MTRTQRMIAAWGVALGVALAPAAGAGEPPASGRKVEDRRAICMMQDTLQQKAGIPYAYNGKTYYLCCEGCRAAVERDPERYTHATDPVNGERVDKADAPIYAYRGHAYYFSSADTLAAFAKTPEKYLRGAASAPPPRQTP